MPVNLGVGDLLAEAGDLTVRRLSRASTWQKTHGGTIERALLSTGAVSEETLTSALAQAYGLPGVSRATLLSADPDIVECLPAKERRRFRAFPFSLSGKVLFIAISDPQNIVLQRNLALATGFSVEIFVAPDPVLEDVIETFDGRPPGRPPSPAESPAVAAPAPAPPAAPAPAPDGDWIDRLGRALLAEALRFDATELEIGADTHGAFLRTFDTAHPAVTRRLSPALLAPLVAWFQERCRRPEGFVAEAALADGPATRRRVDLIAADSHGVRVRLVPLADAVEAPAPARVDVSCAHERARGFIFCPVRRRPLSSRSSETSQAAEDGVRASAAAECPRPRSLPARAAAGAGRLRLRRPRASKRRLLLRPAGAAAAEGVSVPGLRTPQPRLPKRRARCRAPGRLGPRRLRRRPPPSPGCCRGCACGLLAAACAARWRFSRSRCAWRRASSCCLTLLALALPALVLRPLRRERGLVLLPPLALDLVRLDPLLVGQELAESPRGCGPSRTARG